MPYAKVNGVRLYYERHGFPDKPPLVLIHGGQGDSSMLADLVPMFSREFRVLLFDQRGLGRSDKPDVPYTIPLIADDTAALMERTGFNPAHVLGVSLGGMIAQELALRHPDQPLSLVLGCTSPGGPRALRLAARNRAYTNEPLSDEERGRALAEAIFTPGFLKEHPEMVDKLIALRRAHPLDPVGFARRLEAAVAWPGAYDRLSQIACPTLVITGAQDKLVPATNSRLLARAIKGSELVVLDHAGHGFWLERPQESKRALLAFLRRQIAGRATTRAASKLRARLQAAPARAAAKRAATSKVLPPARGGAPSKARARAGR